MEYHTRQQARELGLTHYCTGRPCKQGHVAPRRVSDTNCMECEKLRSRRDMQDPSYAAWKREYNKQWASENKDYLDAYYADWYDRNRGHVNAYFNNLRAKIIQRTPAWADLGAIKLIYENCPPGYHVDHIIPLQGKLVSGLHVHNNLQYLTAEENLRKHNKFDPETFE